MLAEDQMRRYQKEMAGAISLTTRILLSLSAGYLITGAMSVLFFITSSRVNNNGGPGWIHLYDIVTALWMPAIYCSTYLRRVGLTDERVLICLTGIANVIIYSSATIMTLSFYHKWREAGEAEDGWRDNSKWV